MGSALTAVVTSRPPGRSPCNTWLFCFRPSCLDLVTLLRKEMADRPELLKEFEVKITEKQLVRSAAG